MRKLYYLVIAATVLSLTIPVFGQGRDGLPGTAMATCGTCTFQISDTTVSVGNWGYPFTESKHSFYINPDTHGPTSVYLTFFLHEGETFGFTENFVFDTDCTVTHKTAAVTGGVWHHYEWESITGSVPTLTPMLTFEYVSRFCPDPDDSLKIDIGFGNLADSTWDNHFVSGGNTYYLGTLTDGTRSYLDPEVRITVVGPNDATGDTVAISYQGDTVAVPIWEDTISFSAAEGWTVTFGVDAGLHYAGFGATYESGHVIAVDSSVANEITLTGSSESVNPRPQSDVLFGTLLLYLDPDETDVDQNYKVYVKGDHDFHGCATFADTADSDGDTVLIRIPDVAAEWAIADRIPCKGSQDYGVPYFLKTNALVNSNEDVVTTLSFVIDTSGLTYTEYQGIMTEFTYGSDKIYWLSSADVDPYVRIYESSFKRSAQIKANSGLEQVGALIVLAGSTAGTDDYVFSTDSIDWTYVAFLHADTVLYPYDDSLTLTDGSVRVKSCGGGGGCPAVYVWSGERYVMEDFILTHSQYSDDPQPKDDFMPLGYGVAEEDGFYKLQIREFEGEITFLNEVELIAVDYPSQSNVGISIDGEVFGHRESLKPVAAVDHTGRDVLDLVSQEDGVLYEVEGPGSLIVTYSGTTDASSDQRFGIRLETVGEKPPPGNQHAISDLDPWDSDLFAEIEDANGIWRHLGDMAPREYTTLSSQWMIDGTSMDINETFRVRISWRTGYSVDFQALQVPDPTNLIEHRMSLYEASHTTAGKVSVSLANTDEDIITLVPGETIDLVFKAPERIRGYRPNRAFFLKANGYYKTLTDEKSLPTSFGLSDNYPNPFNPSTNVWLSVPQRGEATLKVYNVLGQEVKTIFSGILDAGRHLMTWDGDADGGNTVASGVYFFRLEASGYSQSKKMMLLK